jgi:hypothetical protein
VASSRAQLAAEGLDATLHKKRAKGRQYRKLDGAQEPRLIALACSHPPRGAGPLDHEGAGRQARRAGGGRVRRPVHRLAGASKNELRPWLKQRWVIPPKANAAFVANMEDVLDVYAGPYDPGRPVVCVDEGDKQLIGAVREPLPARPGSAPKQGHEYERGGTANPFMAVEPLAGRRHVEMPERETAADLARLPRLLSDGPFRDAEKIVLVCDNLNTHGPAAPYEAFAPEEARRLASRFEWHRTPRHAGWLNVAEVELSVLARPCLDRRIPDLEALRREVAAWERARNAAVKVIGGSPPPTHGSSSRSSTPQSSSNEPLAPLADLYLTSTDPSGSQIEASRGQAVAPRPVEVPWTCFKAGRSG